MSLETLLKIARSRRTASFLFEARDAVTLVWPLLFIFQMLVKADRNRSVFRHSVRLPLTR